MMKKILFILGVLFGVGLAAAGAVFYQLSQDIPPVETPDLAVVRPELSPEQNAYAAFQAAAEILDWKAESSLEIDYLSGKPVDESRLRELIANNQPSLDLVRQGLDREHCLSPEITDWNTPLPHLRQWRILGSIFAIKTRQDRLAGQFPAATDNCITLLRFANMIQADAQCLPEYLTGIVLLDLGLNQAQDLIRDSSLPSEAINRLSAAFDGLGPFVPGLVGANQCEYQVQCNMLYQLWATKVSLAEYMKFTGSDGFAIPEWLDWPVPSYFFQPNKTKLKFANCLREMIRKAPLCYAQMHPFPKAGKELSQKKGWRLLPNSFGNVFYALSLPAHEGVFQMKCRAECSLAATQILLACTRYRSSEGKLPPDLECLVPRYLPAIPLDPYDGKQFRHSPSKRVIYSVGKDLIDSEGSEVEPGRNREDPGPQRRWKAEDVVYEMEAPDPAS